MKRPGIKALTFDVGGTIFDWRGAIEGEVRRVADAQGAAVDERQFATDWRVRMFEVLEDVKSGSVERMNADEIHRVVLDEVLEKHQSVSLSSSERDELNMLWHRMPSWDGAAQAIAALGEVYTTTVLTVLSFSIVVDCSKLNGITWDGIMSGEFMDHYKKDPEAYQQGARLLGNLPQETMMVATHTEDLMGAKRAGLKTAYVHVQDEWIEEFPTPEPIHALENFDVHAQTFEELVEKLT